MQIFIEFFVNNRYQFTMPTQKPQILLTLTKELLKKIEDFRFDNRIGSRSEAVRQLIEKGLKENPSSSKKSK